MKQFIKNKIKAQALDLKRLKKECKEDQQKNNGSSFLQYAIWRDKKEARLTLLAYALFREKDLLSTDKNWESFTTEADIKKELEKMSLAQSKEVEGGK